MFETSCLYKFRVSEQAWTVNRVTFLGSRGDGDERRGTGDI